MPRKALILLPILLMTAHLAHAQVRPPATVPANQTGTIRGKIVIPFSQVAERIEVILEKSMLQPVARVYSDSLGNFEFNSVLAGTYELVVKFDGFHEVRQRVDVNSGLGNSTTISIFLERKVDTTDDLIDGYPVIDIAELNRSYPKAAMEEYEKAQQDQRKGDSVRAVQRLENAIQLAPDFYNAHNSLGTIYQKLNRYREAERQYNRAHELNPRSAQPLINLGSLYIQESDAARPTSRRLAGRILDEALDALDEAVRVNSQSSVAYYLLGTAYYKSSFFEPAETNLMRALDLERGMPAARLMLANLYVRQRKWQSVLDQLDSYLMENPKADNRLQIEQVRVKVVENQQAAR